jgi:hypothetical protein
MVSYSFQTKESRQFKNSAVRDSPLSLERIGRWISGATIPTRPMGNGACEISHRMGVRSPPERYRVNDDATEHAMSIIIES